MKSEDSKKISYVNKKDGQQNIVHIENSTIITYNDEQNFINACKLIRKELLENLTTLSVYLSIVEDNEPKLFWDIRHPNETKLAYQERVINYHNNCKMNIIQNIGKFKVKRNIYDSYITHLVYNADIADHIEYCYKFMDFFIDDINIYLERYSTNISLNKDDQEIVHLNSLLYQEKMVNLKITILDFIRSLIQAFKDSKPLINIEIENLGYSERFYSSELTLTNINDEIRNLNIKKVDILSKSLRKKKRTITEMNIKDPYLLMLRKGYGGTTTLTEAEKWNIEHKDVDETITISHKLLQAAVHSYLEMDGQAASYYLEKALKNNNYHVSMRIFLQKSLERLKYPDIFHGSIGLIILELEKNSSLIGKGIKDGDVIFKVNGDIVNEPLEISSEIAKTPKNQNILLDIYTKNGQYKKIAIFGSKPLHCKISQLIILNTFQI